MVSHIPMPTSLEEFAAIASRRLFGRKSLAEKLYHRLIELFWLLDIRKVSTAQHGEARVCYRCSVILAPREGRDTVLTAPDEQRGHFYARKLFLRVWFTVIAQVPLDRVAIVLSKALFK